MLPVAAGVTLGVGLLLLLVLWQLAGRGPRRRRALRRAQRLLRQGAWQDALALVGSVQAEGRVSPAWRGRLRAMAGQAHQVAAEQLLKNKQYEEGLGPLREAAGLLGLGEAELRAGVLDRMLAEVRRLFASGTGPAETE